MNRTASLLSLCSLLLIAGCGGGGKSPEEAKGPNGGTVADSAHAGGEGARAADKGPAIPAGKRFAYKSGVVTLKSPTTPGMVANLYFDDYGEKLSTVTDMKESVEGKPITIRNVNVVRDGESILYDPLKKVGMKSATSDGATNLFPAFDALSDSARRAMNYQKLEPRSVAGKECQGHRFVRNGMPVSVWTWGGIPLRTELNYGGGQSHVMEAISLNADTTLSADLFTIPSDIKVKALTKPTLE